MDETLNDVDKEMEEKDMKLSERAQEILETLWINIVEEKKDGLPVGLAEREDALLELLKGGHIQVSGGKVIFKEKGRKEGARVIRRHRLAERLLTDVLSIRKGLIHEMGCKFEHLLFEEVEENVCTLLGHPKVCPHGKAIPPGKCCEKAAREVVRVVCPLKDLEVKSQGKIAYLATNDPGRLNKLMAMGVLPGLSVTMVQTFPSYVFQIGQSQFAVDKELAEGVYVRPEKI
jgi:DtxR family Mn-dependent transcriptional regulator